MPEEKKKESFTFSDKIKNSKPASSKSFANRASSKIGSDGKPRQTLFERTRRDAPFFVAALVALLLLPFLYKYSGSVDEEPTLVTPGYEDSAFNPERSGFDGFGADPDGQIAQLSGRDSMSLILPYGSKGAEEEEAEDEDYYSRSAYAGEGSSASHSLDEQDEEENTTNIYYRKKAPAATRAAFKRAATKINRLPNAGRAGASGGKLGVGMWGGGLKSAAKKVGSPTPQSAPKPVSLQPLQSAGKPSRSYFGQGPAREAARSKDAMSKSNPMQALMDAQMKAVEPGKIGGLFGGDFGGPGGGNGDLKREFLFNGKEPWWWDMMKQQAMMEWQKKFEWKWGIYDWLTGLAKHILEGMINCLFTGNKDGDMGTMFGIKAGSGSEAKCGKYTAESWAKCPRCMTYGEFGKDSCYGLFQYSGQKGGKDPWQSAGHSSSVDLGILGSRIDCLSNGLWSDYNKRKAGEGVVTESDDCLTFYQTGYYRAEVGGKKRTLYHYVVGIPFDQAEKFFALNDPDQRKAMLQIGYFGKGASFVVDSTEVQQAMNKRKFIPLFIESVAIKNKKVNKKTAGKDTYEFEEVGSDELAFLSGLRNPKTGELKTGLTYNEFFSRLRDGGIVITSEAKNTDATIMSAKGSKQGKHWTTGARCAYPMAFVSCRNHALYATNGGIGSGETIAGVPAAFIKLPNVTANNAVMTQAQLDKVTPHFTVMYEIQGENQNPSTGLSTSTSKDTGRMYFANIHPSNVGYDDPRITNDGGIDFRVNDPTYTVKVEGKAEQELRKIVGDRNENEARAVITWTVRQIYNPEEPWAIAGAIADGKGGGRSIAGEKSGTGAQAPGQIVSQATCVYYDGDASTIVVNPHECNNKDESAECCDKLHPVEWKKYEYRNGRCVEIVDDCRDMHESARCCDELHPREWGNNYRYNEETKRCEQAGVPHKDEVHFAPIISWVPDGVTSRTPKKGDQLKKENFMGNRYIPAAEKDETTPTHQHCGVQTPIVMDSQAAYNFVMKVADAYNAQPAVQSGQQSPISKVLTNKYPTDGEFIDALQIAQKLGIKEVPSAAVCELGRDMVRMSRDPHVGNRKAYEGNDFKQLSRYYRNELGAYLAYVHETSVLYPNKWYDGNVGQCDWRFIPEGASCQGKSSDVKMGKAFYYNKYNDSSNYNAKLENYKTSLDAVGIGQNYPLKELVKGKKDLDHNCPVTKCQETRKHYRDSFKGLFWDTEEGTGKACEAFVGQGATMSVTQALKYAKDVCTAGLDRKPYGGGRGEVAYKQGQQFTRTGSSGNSGTGSVQGTKR